MHSFDGVYFLDNSNFIEHYSYLMSTQTLLWRLLTPVPLVAQRTRRPRLTLTPRGVAGLLSSSVTPHSAHLPEITTGSMYMVHKVQAKKSLTCVLPALITEKRYTMSRVDNQLVCEDFALMMRPEESPWTSR